ncbi:hypothetical protein [Microbacterium sp.]
MLVAGPLFGADYLTDRSVFYGILRTLVQNGADAGFSRLSG